MLGLKSCDDPIWKSEAVLHDIDKFLQPELELKREEFYIHIHCKAYLIQKKISKGYMGSSGG